MKIKKLSLLVLLLASPLMAQTGGTPVSVSLSGPPSAKKGNAVKISVVVKNHGDTPLSGVVVTVASSIKFAASVPTTIENLPPGKSAKIIYMGKPMSEGEHSVRVTAKPQGAEPAVIVGKIKVTDSESSKSEPPSTVRSVASSESGGTGGGSSGGESSRGGSSGRSSSGGAWNQSSGAGGAAAFAGSYAGYGREVKNPGAVGNPSMVQSGSKSEPDKMPANEIILDASQR